MARGEVGSGVTQEEALRVKIIWQVGLNQCQTGFGLRSEGLEVVDLVESLADVVAWAHTSFRTLLMDTDTLLGVDIVNVVTKEGNAHSWSNVKGTVSAGTNILPAFLQVPVSLKSELRSKLGQGRMLWPVRSDGYLDGETLNAAGTLAYTGVIDALVAKFVGSGATSNYRMCNFHAAKDAYTNSETGYTRPATPAMYYDVTTVRLNSAVSMVESRKAGRGS